MPSSWKRFARPASWTAGVLGLVLVVSVALSQWAESAQPMRLNIPPGKANQRAAGPATAALPPCSGNFSDGTKINMASPVYLQDVPGGQFFCDFHTFSWNQFIYLTQMQPDPNNGGQVTPLFLHMAPWYNLLKPNGSPPVGPYPGGSTALAGGPLDQGQAGTDDHLLDVKGGTVQYDIRFNAIMYNAIAQAGWNTQAGYMKACNPTPQGYCSTNLFLPPLTVSQSGPPTPGSMDIKTAWRDFGTAANCPATQYYCNGRFGLVGLHIVQKTQTHGEWIWASFEHVANDPDCYPGGDTPITAKSPIGTEWSFFNPATAGSGVMTSRICEVTGKTPQCNANPKYYFMPNYFVYRPINVCRTDAIKPGGANAANCTSVPDGPPQQNSNSTGNVACLNATLMPQRSGVWKNYKMIGSLWIRGTMAPTQDFRVQVFQQPASGLPYGQPVGFPNLANTMMETWMQWGSTGYDPFGQNANQAGCFNCHNPPSSKIQDDLSHYPGKLPQGTITALLHELLPATSTKVVKEKPLPVSASVPHPVK